MNTGLVVSRQLPALLAARPDLVLLGEAIGLSPATAGLAAPGRLVALPAADATLVGVGIGMALGGKPVLVELSGPGSLRAVAGALASEAARFAAAPGFSLPLVVRVPVSPGEVLPVELFGALGVPVVLLAAGEEWSTLVGQLLDEGRPAVLIEAADLPVEALGGAPGGLRLLQGGGVAAILAGGAALVAARAAAAALAAEGVVVDLIEVGRLPAPNLALALSRVEAHGHAVLVGAAAAALPALLAGAFLRLESPPLVVDADPDAIAAAVRSSLAF